MACVGTAISRGLRTPSVVTSAVICPSVVCAITATSWGLLVECAAMPVARHREVEALRVDFGTMVLK